MTPFPFLQESPSVRTLDVLHAIHRVQCPILSRAYSYPTTNKQPRHFQSANERGPATTASLANPLTSIVYSFRVLDPTTPQNASPVVIPTDPTFASSKSRSQSLFWSRDEEVRSILSKQPQRRHGWRGNSHASEQRRQPLAKGHTPLARRLCACEEGVHACRWLCRELNPE